MVVSARYHVYCGNFDVRKCMTICEEVFCYAYISVFIYKAAVVVYSNVKPRFCLSDVLFLTFLTCNYIYNIKWLAIECMFYVKDFTCSSWLDNLWKKSWSTSFTFFILTASKAKNFWYPYPGVDKCVPQVPGSSVGKNWKIRDCLLTLD